MKNGMSMDMAKKKSMKARPVLRWRASSKVREVPMKKRCRSHGRYQDWNMHYGGNRTVRSD